MTGDGKTIPAYLVFAGGEANLGFLTRANPEVTDVADLRDIRMVVIDELKRRGK